MSIVWRPVDGYAAVQQTLADCVNVVDGIGEMAEVSAFAIVFGIPVIREFDLRLFVAGCREKYQSKSPLFVFVAFDFPEAQRAELFRVRELVTDERKALTVRLLQREISTEQFAEGLQSVVETMVSRLSDALTPDEVKAFLGIPDPAAAQLPIDPSRIDPRLGKL